MTCLVLWRDLWLKICACFSTTPKCTLSTASEKLFYQLPMSPQVGSEALGVIFTFFSTLQYMCSKCLSKKQNVALWNGDLMQLIPLRSYPQWPHDSPLLSTHTVCIWFSCFNQLENRMFWVSGSSRLRVVLACSETAWARTPLPELWGLQASWILFQVYTIVLIDLSITCF